MTQTISTEPPAAEQGSRLEHYPITFFATVMGMLGLTLALHAAEVAFRRPPLASEIALGVSVLLMVVVSIGYALKAVRHPRAVHAEWHHPVRVAFFPTISVSLLLLSVAVLPVDRGIAQMLWIAGTALQGVLTLAVISSWIGHRPFEHLHISPAWFIPAVGNVIVPVAGAQLGFIEISWLFFSLGLIFWIVLLTLVINRLIFHAPLPARLQPTLVILIAPPAVAFVAYYRLEGVIDPFARILLNAAYVFLAVVLTQAGKFRNLPFALSWWALSFPMAAVTIASFVYAGAVGSDVHRWLGVGLLLLLLIIVAALIGRTLVAIGQRGICVPE